MPTSASSRSIESSWLTRSGLEGPDDVANEGTLIVEASAIMDEEAEGGGEGTSREPDVDAVEAEKAADIGFARGLARASGDCRSLGVCAEAVCGESEGSPEREDRRGFNSEVSRLIALSSACTERATGGSSR